MPEVLKKTAAGNYTADSVKKYVMQIKNLYDNDFNEMRSRMIALRDENRLMKEELEEYHAKEKYISATVLKAEQLSQHIKDEAEFQARKRINDAVDLEQLAKLHVRQSVEKLYEIQRSVALLLNHVIDTTTALKEAQINHEPALKNAAEIYQFINGVIPQNPKEDTQHMAV